MMTRKNFRVIAGCIHSVYDKCNEEEKAVIKEVAVELSNEFRWENERFSRERFLEACGVE